MLLKFIIQYIHWYYNRTLRLALRYMVQTSSVSRKDTVSANAWFQVYIDFIEHSRS